MSKREQPFHEADVFKKRALSVAQLLEKQAIGYLSKPAAAAIRQLIAEKEELQEIALPASRVSPQEQRAMCKRFGADYLATPCELKLGIALSSLNQVPLNGLRHSPAGETTGWYLWGGGDLSQDPAFFQPLHVAHLHHICAAAIPYLGLAPGWRFLLAPNQEDVWFDASLLQPK